MLLVGAGGGAAEAAFASAIIFDCCVVASLSDSLIASSTRTWSSLRAFSFNVFQC